MKTIRGLVVRCYCRGGTNVNIKLEMAGQLKGVIRRSEVILYYYWVEMCSLCGVCQARRMSREHQLRRLSEVYQMRGTGKYYKPRKPSKYY
jgi:hypothetical protein